jgi:(p)ppGpp synthase/HD superfamily hydrolase
LRVVALSLPQKEEKCAFDPMNSKIIKAIEFAFVKHEGQLRKGSEFPYIVHPLSVMRLLLLEQASDSGVADDVIIAGVLHDVVEDTDATLDEIEELFGTEVQRLVGTASEPEELKKDPNQKETWKKRKLHTTQNLRTLDKPAKILSCCDKLDNARSMNDDFALVGNGLWERFNAPKEDIFWYYKECVKAYETGVSIEDSRAFRLLKIEVEILSSH